MCVNLKRMLVSLLAMGLFTSFAQDTDEQEVPTNAAQQVMRELPERYRTILERMPFGVPPENFDPNNPLATEGQSGANGALTPQEQQQQMAEEQMRAACAVSMINVTPEGDVYVGWTDQSVTPPRDYYMRVGETKDGWKILEVDPYETKRVKFENKDGIQADVELGGSSLSKPSLAQTPKLIRARGASSEARSTQNSHVTAVSPPTLLRNVSRAEDPPSEGGALANLKRRRREQLAQKQEAEREKKESRELVLAAQAQADAVRQEQREMILQLQDVLAREREERLAKEAAAHEEASSENQ